MTAYITKIWIDKFDSRRSIRADLSNDWHYRTEIEFPYGNEESARALFDLASLIFRSKIESKPLPP